MKIFGLNKVILIIFLLPTALIIFALIISTNLKTVLPDLKNPAEVERNYTLNNDKSSNRLESRNINEPNKAERSFSKVAAVSTEFKASATGDVNILSVNLTGQSMIDVSKYNADYVAFIWRGNKFLWGMNETELSVVEAEELLEGESDYFYSVLYGLYSDVIYLDVSGNISHLQIHLISSSKSDKLQLSAVSNYSSGPKYSTLNVIPREQWSGDPNINDPRLRSSGGRLVWEPYYYRTQKFVIHHTATGNGEDPITMMRAIYSYHSITLDLGDIGYNYLIDQYGNIYEGKLGGDEAKGYHAGTGGNPESVGISILGTYTSAEPSAAAKDALIRLMAEKAAFHNLNLTWHSTVFGHRDFMATACPGNTFYDALPSITSQAQLYLNGNFGEIKTKTAHINEGIDSYSYKDGELLVEFRNSNDLNSFFASQIPIDPNTGLPAFWSGIESYITNGNQIILQIDYYNETGNYNSVDRLRDLYKIFLLDPRTESAGPNFRYSL